MNKIEKLLEENFSHVPMDDLDSAYIQTYASTIYDMLYQFGKDCFEAGLENKKLYNPEKDGSLTMITIIPEYKTYEDYLKSLEIK